MSRISYLVIRSWHAKNGANIRSLRLPDLWVSDVRQPKAVEIELTLKEYSRYRRLWTAYRSGLPREAVLLYITAWPHGPKAILSRARDMLMDFVYVCDLAEFEESAGTCAFVGYRGGEIRLAPQLVQPGVASERDRASGTRC